MDGKVALPLDAKGVPIRPGDKLRLAHNGRTVTVRSLEFAGMGVWTVWPEESGGGFVLPATAYNVTHVG